MLKDSWMSVYKSQLDTGRLREISDFPKVVLIDTVSYCNLKCSMCIHKDMTRKKGVIEWNLFTKIIDEIAENNKDIRVWMVFFGEPFILNKTKPSIFDMIRYAKSKGLTDVVLNSNGSLMDKDAAVKLIESGLDAIYFGIDALKPETYLKLRVGGDYDKTVNNILTLLNLKKELNSDLPKVFVQFVEMDENINEKDDFIKFWSQYDVTVKIRPKVSWAGNIEASNLTLGNEERWPCHWLMQTMSIADDGRVVLCPVDLDAKVVVGDVKKETLKSIWQNQLKTLRRLHIEGKYNELPQMCRDCRDWQSARSDYYNMSSKK